MAAGDSLVEILGILGDVADQLESGTLTLDQQHTAGWILRATLHRLAHDVGCSDASTVRRDPAWIPVRL